MALGGVEKGVRPMHRSSRVPPSPPPRPAHGPWGKVTLRTKARAAREAPLARSDPACMSSIVPRAPAWPAVPGACGGACKLGQTHACKRSACGFWVWTWAGEDAFMVEFYVQTRVEGVEGQSIVCVPVAGLAGLGWRRAPVQGERRRLPLLDSGQRACLCTSTMVPAAVPSTTQSGRCVHACLMTAVLPFQRSGSPRTQHCPSSAMNARDGAR